MYITSPTPNTNPGYVPYLCLSMARVAYQQFATEVPSGRQEVKTQNAFIDISVAGFLEMVAKSILLIFYTKFIFLKRWLLISVQI